MSEGPPGAKPEDMKINKDIFKGVDGVGGVGESFDNGKTEEESQSTEMPKIKLDSEYSDIKRHMAGVFELAQADGGNLDSQITKYCAAKGAFTEIGDSLGVEPPAKVMETFGPPGRHVDVHDESRKSAITQQWNHMKEAAAQGERGADAIDKIADDVYLGIVTKDNEYQDRERGGADKHASKLRQMIIEGHDKRLHPSLKNMMETDMKDRLMKYKSGMENNNQGIDLTDPDEATNYLYTKKLVQDWESNHPGEKFFPEEEAAE